MRRRGWKQTGKCDNSVPPSPLSADQSVGTQRGWMLTRAWLRPNNVADAINNNVADAINNVAADAINNVVADVIALLLVALAG